MQIKVITSNEEFYKLKEDWERLQGQDSDVTYYSTFKFIREWWNIYEDATNNSLFIICVYVGKEIVAIAPLMIKTVKKFKLTYRVLKFLGRGDYFNFILDKASGVQIASLKNIFKEIFKSCEWDKVQLTHINSNSYLAYFMLSHLEYNKEFKYLIECPIIDFVKYHSFEEYKKLYSIDKENNRYINKLQNEIGYKFNVVKNDEFDVYKKISQLHITEQAWLIKTRDRMDRASLFSNNEYSEFVRNIYKDNENVISFILEDNDSNLLSYYTCYFYKGIIHCWNTAYNPQYGRYELNKILSYETVKYIFENKLASKFDFGAGRYPWKFKWTKDFVVIYQFEMWNNNTKKGKCLKLLHSIRGR